MHTRRPQFILDRGQRLALYFCHLSRNGVRFDDARGFQADSHDDAKQVATAIGAVILKEDPGAGDAMLELRSEGGDLLLNASLSALLTDLQ